MKKKIKKVLMFILNPRLLFCLAIAWMITNGWSYIVFSVGTYFKIPWMIAVGGAYLAFLWLPISPEKIVTVAIALALLKYIFPKDEKTLAVLHDMHLKLKSAISSKKKKKKGNDSDKKEV